MNNRNHLFPRFLTEKKVYPAKLTQPYFAEDAQSLSARASNSTIWSFSKKVGESGIGLLTIAVVARVLFPADFGLVAMATLTMGIVGLFQDYGLGAAIIYKKDVDRVDLSTVFWLNLSVSIVLYVICILISPLAEMYFKNENISPIINIIALNFIIGGMGSVNNTILNKQLRFRELAYAGFSSALMACIVTLSSVVIFGLGYWGLIFGALSGSLTATFLKYYFTRWYPQLVFDIQRLKGMFNYGKNIFFQRILYYFASNIDYFIIGRIIGVAALGIYRFAYSIPHKILTDFSLTLSSILFPTLCKVTDEPERFKRGYLKAIKYISFISFPAMTGLFSVADHFINVIYSERYIQAVIPMKILCFSGMSRSILATMGSIFNSKGRPDIELKWNLSVFPVIIITVYIGSQFGLNGVALAMTLTAQFSFIAAWLSMRLAKIKFTSYLGALSPAFAGSILVLIVVVFMSEYGLPKFHLDHISSLIILVAVGVFTYISYLFMFFRSDALEFINFVKGGIKK
ncbi:MAG: MOP flippase family protein [Nitrospirota bacterium]